MTDDEVKLLEAVAADFDSDEPRRAYGRWLVAQNDGWGELVLASLEPPPADAKRKRERDKQLDKLCKAHAKTHFGVSYKCIPNRAGGFERGFPTSVGGDVTWVVRAASELALRAPRARLTVHEVRPKHIAALAPVCAALPGGDQLTTIEFDEAAFVRLAKAGILSAFSHARLLFSLGEQGVAALVEHGSSLGSVALGHLADPTPLFASKLALGNLSLACDRLTSALRTYALPTDMLVVNLQDFDDGDVDLLLAAPSAQQLTWLGLARTTDAPTRLTAAGTLRLVRGLARLRTLNLGGTWGLDRDTATEISTLLASR